MEQCRRVALDFKIPIIPTPSATHTAKLTGFNVFKKRSKRPILKKIKENPLIFKTTTISIYLACQESEKNLQYVCLKNLELLYKFLMPVLQNLQKLKDWRI